MKKSENNVVSLFEQTNQGVQKAVLTDSMKMKRGGSLSNPIVAYETWGKLSKQKDNVELINSNKTKPQKLKNLTILTRFWGIQIFVI